MNYFRRAHSKEVTIFHRRLLFLIQWLSVIYLTIFLFTNYQVLIFSFHKSFAYLAFYIPINQILYICTLSQNLPSKSEGTNFDIFAYRGCILRLEASTFSYRPWWHYWESFCLSNEKKSAIFWHFCIYFAHGGHP